MSILAKLAHPAISAAATAKTGARAAAIAGRTFTTSAPVRSAGAATSQQARGLMRYMPKTRAGKMLLAGVVLSDLAFAEYWYFWRDAGAGKKK